MQYRQVECAPPSDLVVNVDDNDGGNGWIRLQITVREHNSIRQGFTSGSCEDRHTQLVWKVSNP